MTPLGQCFRDSDCQDLYVCTQNACVHKDIFPPTPVEIVATIIMCAFNSLGSAAGVAEAGLLSSYLMIFLNYTLTGSISCASAVGLGGALGNFVNVIFQRHPETKKPFVNYDINLIVIPMLMAGVFIGVNVPKVAPNMATIIILFIVLGISSYKFAVNLMKQLKREHEYKGNLKELATGSEVNPSSETDLSSQKLLVEREEYNPQTADQEEAELTEFMKEEQRLIPWNKYREILIMVLAIVIFVLLRGSKTTKSLIEIPYCGVYYWLALPVILLFFVGMFYRTSRLVQSWQAKRLQMGLKYHNELQLNKERILKIGGLAGCAGIIGASISIGGGMIMQPFFLQWGLPPRDISYTCSFFIIMTLFNTTYQQFVTGNLKLDQIIWFGGIAFLCSFVSSILAGWYVRKTGKQSLLLKFLLIVSAISIMMEVYVVVDEVKHDLDDLLAWKNICA